MTNGLYLKNQEDDNMRDEDWRRELHYSIDPFPEIEPSLLNSADIIRYAEIGCLVDEFCRTRLNPATYTIRLLGTLYSWEPKGNRLFRRQQEVVEDTSVTIRANSISYLFTREEFRLPEYIAARFNLHIRYVHKGILLGTGPLVDPGFAGPLLIPLHNLTDNDYVVEGGDNLLWVEFTKLTSHNYWSRPSEQQDHPKPDELVSFNTEKFQINAERYFEKSGVTAASGVLSAFKGALEDSRKLAKESEQSAANVKKTVQWLTAGGIVGGALGIAALLFSAWQLWQGNSDMAGRIHDRLDRIERATGLLPPKRNVTVIEGLDDSVNGDETLAREANEPAVQGKGK